MKKYKREEVDELLLSFKNKLVRDFNEYLTLSIPPLEESLGYVVSVDEMSLKNKRNGLFTIVAQAKKNITNRIIKDYIEKMHEKINRIASTDYDIYS